MTENTANITIQPKPNPPPNKSKTMKFNRGTFSIVTLDDEDIEDKTYWHSKSPKERLVALEYLRQVMYGYDPNTTRLQRVFEIVTFPPS